MQCPKNNKWHNMGLSRCTCDNPPTPTLLQNPEGGVYGQAFTNFPLERASLAVTLAANNTVFTQNYVPLDTGVQWGMFLHTLDDVYRNAFNKGVYAPAYYPETYLDVPGSAEGKPFTSVAVTMPAY